LVDAVEYDAAEPARQGRSGQMDEIADLAQAHAIESFDEVGLKTQGRDG
jgi:hypothetical protein